MAPVGLRMGLMSPARIFYKPSVLPRDCMDSLWPQASLLLIYLLLEANQRVFVSVTV